MRLVTRTLPALSLFFSMGLASEVALAMPPGGRVPRPRAAVSQTRVPSSDMTSLGDTSSRGVEGRTPRQGPSRLDGLVAPRVNRVSFYPGTRLLVPPAWERCRVMPAGSYWRHRDLMAELQWMSRYGFIPVTPLGNSVEALSDFTQKPAGWRAYGISVPAGGTLQVDVKHEKLGWFRLMLVDRWGRPGPGMLQAAVANQPVLVTYKNPGKEATAVYVIVDDPAWWSDAQNPYTLEVRRDWDPAKTDLSQVKLVAGLWGASPSVSAEFAGPSLTGPAVYPH